VAIGDPDREYQEE